MATSLTYPVPALSGTAAGNLSTEQIHQLLRNQNVVARRVRTLAAQRFISDALLTGRYRVEGGAVLYETSGDPVFLDDDPEVIAPGGEYPRSQANAGDLAAARVDKWGRDIPITDESIKRRGIDVVDRSFSQLINRMVRFVDSAALGVIASKVTATYASAAWTSTAAIVDAIEQARAVGEESGEGHTFDTIVLKPTQYAKVMGLFLASGLLPREQNNPLLTGTWPTILDVRWLRSPHTPTTAPLLLDTDELGGMADENLGGPGYARVQNGIETKSIREDHTDGYLLRGRRVTVPIVADPTAGLAITGTGL